MKLTPLQKQIIKIKKKHPRYSNVSIGKEVGCSHEHVRQTLAMIKD